MLKPHKEFFIYVSMLTVGFRITDHTSAEDLDSYFNQIWKHQEKVVLFFDTTQCSRITLGRALKMKSVLDKHRENSRKFIDHSNIMVKSGFARNVLRTALAIIRTERPVYVTKVT
jgi:hypothetical protein